LSVTVLIAGHFAFCITGSSDSENGLRNNDLNMKTTVLAGTVQPVEPEMMRSRQLPPPPADRCLPKPPAVHDLQNVNPDMNASRQSFRLAMGNTCKLHVWLSTSFYPFHYHHHHLIAETHNCTLRHDNIIQIFRNAFWGQ